MFKIFTAHPVAKGKSYLGHAWFALKIATRLSLSSTFLYLHALFPFIKVPCDLNLESMVSYLSEKNNELED